MMAIFGLGSQVDQIQEAIKKGDPAEIAVRFVQLICMLFGLTSQCFTGDTLVSTEDGLRPIEEIQAGDYVWSENTESGEKELKKVLSVSVTETKVLVHVTTENGTVINTTENHPFYVEGKGWCAAAELEDGDVLRTQDGETETVEEVWTEQLSEAVRVYNLEIEESHTYYVSVDGVLVHNACDDPDLYHYTDEKSAMSIESSGVIRADNKWRVFVTTDKIPAGDVNNALFLGQKPMSGEYVIEIFLNDPTDFRLSSEGVTQHNELIYIGSIRNGKNASIIVKENIF